MAAEDGSPPWVNRPLQGAPAPASGAKLLARMCAESGASRLH
jgi:hypothetical protein